MIGFKYTPIALHETPLELRQVDAAWHDACGRAFAPTRRALDLFALPASLIPFTSITDYDPDGDAFSIRFFGSGLAAIDGVDLTGHPLGDTPNEGLRDSLFELFRNVIETRGANFAEFHFVTLSGVSSMSVTGRWPSRFTMLTLA